MKLSISNIGWDPGDDLRVYTYMKEMDFEGLEIAPTRIIPDKPYDSLNAARNWKDDLFSRYRFSISSMQSIWFGRVERIYGTDAELYALISYTKKAIDFAEAIGCDNIVFGCPQNRSIPDVGDIDVALKFFRTIGNYAASHHTVIAIEANPRIYGTNFLNTTDEALDFIEQVNSNGVLLNLDIGTMIENKESVEIIKGREHLINHVHVSEPYLKPIQERALHHEIAKMMEMINYQRYVSIEVGRQCDIKGIENMMRYVKKIFV